MDGNGTPESPMWRNEATEGKLYIKEEEMTPLFPSASELLCAVIFKMAMIGWTMDGNGTPGSPMWRNEATEGKLYIKEEEMTPLFPSASELLCAVIFKMT